MTNLFRDTIELSTKKWWVHLLLGVVLIALGVWVSITPLASYISLTFFFCLAISITGLFEIFAAIRYRKEDKNWGWHLSVGILDLLVGWLLILNPLTTMSIVPYLVAVWLIYKGLVAMGTSLRIKSWGYRGWGWLFVFGLWSMAFAILIIVYPVLGGLSIVITTAMAFLALGMFHISVAYHFRKLYKRINAFELH